MANDLLLGNPLQSFNDGFDRGQQQQFNRLAGQFVSDPSANASALNAAAAIDPSRALEIQKGAQASTDARQKKLAGAASYLLNAYKSGNAAQTEGAYQSVRPYLDNLGKELGQGPASPHFTEEMLPHLYQIVGDAGGDTAINGDLPSGVREFNAMTANLSPGDLERARRINLGLDPRAVTGAAKTFMVKGRDGRERPGIFDPATQDYKVFDGGVWRPIGADESAQPAMTSAPAASVGPAILSKPSVDELLRQATRMANEGGPGKNQAAAQAWLNQQVEANGYRPSAPTPADLAVGRPAEVEAGAVQNAKNASDLAYLPQTEAVKTQADIERAGGTATAKGQAERQLDQPQAQASLTDASSNLDRLATTATRLMQHPGLTGITSWQARVPDIPGSDAANARAELQTLRSQVGFGVLQAMRNASKTGGALGSVSDAEGARLENNLAALEQSQSPQAFKENLQRIVDYANQAKGRLNTAYQQAYGGSKATPQASATQHPTPRTQADFDALPSGSLYVDPDDGKTYRKP